MKKIRVLNIVNRFNLGGIVHYVSNISKSLDSENFESLIIGGKIEDHETSAKFIFDHENIKIKELPRMRRKISLFNDLISFIEILIIIKNFKPDIVHTHAAKAGLLGRFCYFFCDAKFIHSYHGNIFDGYFSSFKNKLIILVERFLALNTDLILALSSSQKSDLVEKYKICNLKKIKVLPIGLDLDKFINLKTQKRNNYRRKLCIDDNVSLISIIGRIVPIKNHKLFIDSFLYCKNKLDKNIKAVIVGDGSETQKMIDYAIENKLNVCYKINDLDFDIFFSSWMTDVTDIIAASDVVVLTSLNEGTPVSIIEAMAGSKACVSTNDGGVSEIIENNSDGIISSSNQIDFGKSIIKIISDPIFKNKIQINAKKKSLSNFNIPIFANRINLIYKSLNQKI